MLGNYFYHARIRKAVASFGSLFDDIYVIRTNSAGETISQVKVPLSYGPKRDFIARIQQSLNGEEAERMVALKLPRMSFEITGIQYDAARQLNKMNKTSQAISGTNTRRSKVPQSVPYTLNFQLSVYAKSQDDALQIVEQVIPSFNPKYIMAIKPFSNITAVSEDVPITLDGVSMEDSYEGALEQRRTIIYTLDFTMNVNFYGEIDDNAEIIRTVNTDLYIIGADSDQKVVDMVTVTDPTSAEPEDDYGFTTTITETFE